jgi:para-nitrobenzyl esterase
MTVEFPTGITRRRYLQQASLTLAGSMAAPAILLAQGSGGIAETTNGKVRGTSIGGILSFRGIPYGADTSGRNRFMPPVKPASWAGERDCTSWGHVAPQRNNTSPDAYGQMVGWNNYRGGMSEDCLVVNVWTPAVKDGGKRAVLVCFHGGGYTSGSGNLVALEGQFMAKAGDMVVVTVNHRLGALGYLDLSAFGGADLAASGLVGMMDCVAALQWVRDNIANFGGDPGRILISGQSGGGGKCSVLMAMPSAAGLFHRAAIQSGSTIRVATPDAAQRTAGTILAKLGIVKGDLTTLQSLPFDQIIAAQEGVGPVVDGTTLPRQPFDPDSPAVSATVPMLIGTCLEDFGFGVTDKTDTEESLKSWTEGQFPGKSTEILATYRRIYPGKRPFLIKGMIATDQRTRRNAVQQAERKSAQGTAAYLYRWDWPVPGGGGIWGAVHGSDLSASMSNPTTDMTLDTPEARIMAHRIGAAFIAFAKTGDPNTSAIPHWDAYNATKRPVMIFDTKTRMQKDPDRDLRLMWDKLLA